MLRGNAEEQAGIFTSVVIDIQTNCVPIFQFPTRYNDHRLTLVRLKIQRSSEFEI